MTWLFGFCLFEIIPYGLTAFENAERLSVFSTSDFRTQPLRAIATPYFTLFIALTE